MFLARLHSLGWHRPNRPVQIHLSPRRADHFTGAGGGEDCKFQCQRSDRVTLAQL